MITYLPIAQSQQLATCSAGRQCHNVFSSSTIRRRQVTAQFANNPVRGVVRAEATSKSRKQTSAQTTKAAKAKPARASAAADPEVMDIQGQEVDTRIPVTVRLQPVMILLQQSASPGSAQLLICSMNTAADPCRSSLASLGLERRLY